MVDLHFKLTFEQILPFREIKRMPKITGVALVKKGHRLSIMPVKQSEFEWLLG